MSIVPVGDQRIGKPSSLDLWDSEDLLSLDLWDPFQGFPLPSIISTHFPSIFPSLETQVNWRETPNAHVFRAVFPSSNREDVLVYIDDDNMLQISTDDGKFMSKFKLPENAKREEATASMVNGVLTLIIPKEGMRSPNVRVIEISGSG
ncbi:hypothetical protein K2173_016770 [Erythroxylum novogranatense]|uniref:SHSP domain-containing protein n=1 Tax=Erythroxylum novogranatense TaxID=1862640 RepID=A0AAV8SGZ9_9ROSI|nr:hypothetical protein K2173_016770 [Erythroxylum novogranatense]